MDTSYQSIFDKLAYYEEKQPLIVKIWKNYLARKKKNLLQNIEKCERILQYCDTVPELTEMDILLLIFISNLNI